MSSKSVGYSGGDMIWSQYGPISEGLANEILGSKVRAIFAKRHRLDFHQYLASWWTYLLATDPPFQRQGFARKIIDGIFAQASANLARLSSPDVHRPFKTPRLWHSALPARRM